ERLDGLGYPDGLSGEQIPLLARIVTVVDIFDALTTTRPYRQALSAATAYAMLRDNARGGGCDGALVERFISLHVVQHGAMPSLPRVVTARPARQRPVALGQPAGGLPQPAVRRKTAKCGTAMISRARKKRPVDRSLRA
ncbi:MAG: HD-GYP domain-containing protein, partial [Vicinamibacterales bacterium]